MSEGSSDRRRSFPPGVGWIPATIAIVVMTIAASVAAIPHYASRSVGPGGVTGDASAQNTDAGSAPGAAAAQSGNPGAQPGRASGGSGAKAGAGTGANPAAGGQAAGAGSTGPGAATGQLHCAAGQNGGSTAPGVSASEIHIASTIVTTGVGSGFLGEGVNGMQAAINEQNSAGGICGRRITISTINSGWDYSAGKADIDNYINSGSVFALVGEPDSEGLAGAIDGLSIDRAKIPVVGTDGMLADQYSDPWVWPVAASTVSNMHIAAKYAKDHGAKTFGIVFDKRYKFGVEGAYAFDQEVKRLTGSDIPGYDPSLQSCSQAFCGISSDRSDYGGSITTLNAACKPCDVVVMLLEPQPMETWMKSEAEGGQDWYRTLMGGEPLFDDNFASTCGDNCNQNGHPLIVWTGYHPAIQPFDAEKPVYTYAQSLKAFCPSCDSHNEFTEGAYLGTKMFLNAVQRVGPNLTRDGLKQVLDSQTFDFGLSSPLRYGALPHVANTSMAAFSVNTSGSFNGWNYLNTGYLDDPARGQDLRR